jgi:thioredoxin 1
MTDYNQSNFEKEVLRSEMPVLIDFWAPWCGPCKMVAPVIAEIASEYQGRILVGKVNIDDNELLANQYEVMSIPTICLFHKGKLMTKLIGFRPKKEIITEMTKYL